MSFNKISIALGVFGYYLNRFVLILRKFKKDTERKRERESYQVKSSYCSVCALVRKLRHCCLAGGHLARPIVALYLWLACYSVPLFLISPSTHKLITSTQTSKNRASTNSKICCCLFDRHFSTRRHDTNTSPPQWTSGKCGISSSQWLSIFDSVLSILILKWTQDDRGTNRFSRWWKNCPSNGQGIHCIR